MGKTLESIFTPLDTILYHMTSQIVEAKGHKMYMRAKIHRQKV